MAETHQVGYAVYIVNGLEVEKTKETALRGLFYTALAHRLRMPAPGAVDCIVHPPKPDSPDPLEWVGTVGYKGRTTHLPWYAGWLDALWARWQLWRLARVG